MHITNYLTVAFDYRDQHNLRLADRISPVKEAISKVTDLIKFMEIRIRGNPYSHTRSIGKALLGVI